MGAFVPDSCGVARLGHTKKAGLTQLGRLFSFLPYRVIKMEGHQPLR